MTLLLVVGIALESNIPTESIPSIELHLDVFDVLTGGLRNVISVEEITLPIEYSGGRSWGTVVVAVLPGSNISEAKIAESFNVDAAIGQDDVGRLKW